jgi:hypothetical protein
MKALQRSVTDRYQKMSEFSEDLRAALLGNPVSVYHEPIWGRVLKWRDRKVFSAASLIWMLAGATLCFGVQLLVRLVVKLGEGS